MAPRGAGFEAVYMEGILEVALEAEAEKELGELVGEE